LSKTKQKTKPEQDSSIISNVFRVQEEEKWQIARTFFHDDEDLPFKTDLTPVEIKGIIQAEMKQKMVLDYFGIDLRSKEWFTKPFKAHMVSKSRMGRAEIVEIMREPTEEERLNASGQGRSRSRFKRLLGV
jgi:hypothetical protein